MPTPATTDTTFFRRVQKNASQFMLASDQEARLRAVQGAFVIGSARAHNIPARMPCCIDHGLVPADATIILTDLK